MAFFDSPKNRALWDKELAELRKEKEARANKNKHGAHEREEGINNEMASHMSREAGMANNMEEMSRNSFAATTPFRERTSYKQLLAEEAASVRAARSDKSRTVQKSKSQEMGAEPTANMGNFGSGSGF